MGSLDISEGNITKKKNTHRMRLTETTSGEAAQMPTSASSTWGLGSKVRTASSILRVSPEDSLRGLI